MEKREQMSVLWPDELHRSGVNLVGGKSSPLGEVTSAMKIPISYGFATIIYAYRQFMVETGLNDQINKLLAEINGCENADELHRACSHIRQMIVETPIPSEIAMTIKKAYATLSGKTDETEPFVAIRPSAAAGDLPNTSFAGQQESYSNVRGAEMILTKVQEYYASLFTDRVAHYRYRQHFPHEKVTLSAIVQMMVLSKASGVVFSVNVANGNDTQIAIDTI